MKAIFIEGEDFSALYFEEHFKGKSVVKIIKEQELEQKTSVELEGDDYYYTIELIDVGQVSKKFLKFIRDNMIEYDFGKQKNFWLDNEII